MRREEMRWAPGARQPSRMRYLHTRQRWFLASRNFCADSVNNALCAGVGSRKLTHQYSRATLTDDVHASWVGQLRTEATPYFEVTLSTLLQWPAWIRALHSHTGPGGIPITALWTT